VALCWYFVRAAVVVLSSVVAMLVVFIIIIAVSIGRFASVRWCLGVSSAVLVYVGRFVVGFGLLFLRLSGLSSMVGWCGRLNLQLSPSMQYPCW
jgi:threonine/homoserine/homoserine lactone efflux protein